ncbi:hypothetical protein B484DRAFT_410534, partial [Ochromonadaceae sp. CCMP2298]
CKSNTRLREVEDEIGELQDAVNSTEHSKRQAHAHLDEASTHIAGQQVTIEQLQEEMEVLRRPVEARSKSKASSDDGAGAGEEDQLAELRKDLAARSARSKSGGRSPASAEDSAGESPSGEDSADESPREEREVTETLRRAADALRLSTADPPAEVEQAARRQREEERARRRREDEAAAEEDEAYRRHHEEDD